MNLSKSCSLGQCRGCSGCRPISQRELSGLVDDFRETWGDLWNYAKTELNLPVPLDKEIGSLRAGRDHVKAAMARTTSVLQKIIPAIENQTASGMVGPRVADALKQEGDIAYGKGQTVIRYYANAIIAAQNAQALIKTGRPDARVAADFAAKKILAEREGNAARARFEKFFANTDTAWKQVVGSGEIGKALVQLPGDVARQFARTVAPYVPSAAQTTKIAAALPWIIGGVIALQLLPTVKALGGSRQ